LKSLRRIERRLYPGADVIVVPGVERARAARPYAI